MSAAMIKLIIQIILYIIVVASQKNKAPDASTLADSSVPTTSESKAISFGYGTFQNAGNVVWYGDFDTDAIKIDGGLFMSDQTVGYKYFLGLHFMLNHSLSSLLKIEMNDKEVWSRNDDSQTESFRTKYDKPDFISEDNGVSGYFQFYNGSDNQNIDPYLVANGLDIPKFNNISHVVFEKNYIGNSNSLQTVKFTESSTRDHSIFDQDKIKITSRVDEVEAELGELLAVLTPIDFNEVYSITNEDGSIEYTESGNNFTIEDYKIVLTDQLTASNPILEEQNLIVTYETQYFDLNPAVIMYDIAVNEDYGVGLDENLLDQQSFIDASETLYDEGFGLSLLYESAYSGIDFQDEINRHISSVLVEDFYTGLIKLKLIRNDYDVDALTIFNESNIVTMDKYDRVSIDELYNEVKIEYTNKANSFSTSIAQFQNEGLRIEKASAVQSVTQSFPFITDTTIANQVAYREAIPFTTAMARIEFTCTKTLGLEVGDVIKLSWNEYDIENMVIRVQDVNYGTFSSNTMKVVGMQDTFGIQFTSYSNPTKTKFKPIDFSAKPTDLHFFDAPRFMKNELGIVTYARKPTGTSLKYSLLIDEENAGESTGFCPYAQITTAFNELDNEIEISTSDYNRLTSSDNEQLDLGGNLCYVLKANGEHEFLSFSTIVNENNQWKLQDLRRGCCDTLPLKFDINDEIYFISYAGIISQNVNLINSQNIQIKALTVTNEDKLSSSEAPVINYTLPSVSRNERPILPANLKANNSYVFDNVNIGLLDVLDLTWAYRKTENQIKIRDYRVNDEATNDSTQFHIVIKDNLDVVLKDITVSDNFYVFSDEETFNTELNININSIKNGIESLNEYNFNVYRV